MLMIYSGLPVVPTRPLKGTAAAICKDTLGGTTCLRPVHLSRVSLLRVLESNFPGDPLSNSADMRIPTPDN